MEDKENKAPVIPEYYGKTPQEFGEESAKKYAFLAAVPSAAVGAGVGYFAGPKLKWVERSREVITEVVKAGYRQFANDDSIKALKGLNNKVAGAIAFAAISGVAVGAVAAVIGRYKGYKKGERAVDQHRELYERLSRLEAQQGQAKA